MKAIATSVETPVGKFSFPMNPGFTKDLEKCNTNEDLFKLVNPNGFINPDAFCEVQARGIYFEYLEWKQNNSNKENHDYKNQ